MAKSPLPAVGGPAAGREACLSVLGTAAAEAQGTLTFLGTVAAEAQGTLKTWAPLPFPVLAV